MIPQALRQNARRYFSNHSKMFFPVPKKLFIEKEGKNLVLLVLKSKFEGKLNEVPHDFSIKYSGINLLS